AALTATGHALGVKTRTPSLPRLTALSAALLLAMSSGCTSAPMLDYNLRVPAQTLIPPGAPPVQDGRERFREIFCALLAQEPGAATRPCEVLLHRLSDEPALERR